MDEEPDNESPLKDRLRDENPLPDAVIDEQEERIIFEQIKSGLTAREQLFVELYYTRELSPSEISNIMNITANNIYQLKSLVRKKMKKVVAQYL